MLYKMVGKKIFKKGESIHFGAEAEDGYSEATKDDVKEAFKKKKKLWRCTICNDVHMGGSPPKKCPTCKTINAYVKINEDEFKKIIGI